MAAGTAQVAARGAAWAIGTSVLSRVISLIGTLVLVRFVAPGDYGEASAATIVVSTINQFGTLGVGLYVIAKRDASREELFHATVIHVALGVLAVAVLLLFGRSLAPLFGTPHLYGYVPLLALAFFLERASFMPERVLVRGLRFRRIGGLRSLSEITYAAVSVATAVAGWGGMAIVIGNVARSCVKLIGMASSVPRLEWLQLGPLRWSVLRAIGGYGLVATVGQFGYYASRRWDNLLMSYLHGPAVMGAYNLAYNLADTPAAQVGEQISDVMQAAYAHMTPAERRDLMMRSIGVIGLASFPIALGLGAVAPTLADLFLDKDWAGTGMMLMVLSALSVVRPIYDSITAFVIVERGPRPLVWVEWVTLAVMLLGIATLGRISPLWACGAVGIAYSLRALFGLYVAKVGSGIDMLGFLSQLVAPLVACAPMVAAVTGLRVLLTRLDVAKPVAQLIFEIPTGIVVFIASAFVMAPQSARQLLSIVRDRARAKLAPPVVAPGSTSPANIAS
jgi:lipopolysaccharide exporter